MLRGYFKHQGLTLIELLLVIALSGSILLAALSAHSYVWGQTWQGQLQVRETQNFYALGHWLARDLQYELQNANAEWQWRGESRCLLFADKGVRLRNKQLQWKPNEGDCNSPRWLALHDSAGFEVTEFAVTSLSKGYVQLCAVGQVEKLEPLSWCYSLRNWSEQL